MKIRTVSLSSLALLVLALILVACSSNKFACSPDAPNAPLPYITPLPTQASQNYPGIYINPAIVIIGGREISVDKVVHGKFCDDLWNGKVFVDCDIEVAVWKETLNFLDDCNLSISEGTIVYVAAHNNQVFYKGCSCHYTDEKFLQSSPP